MSSSVKDSMAKIKNLQNSLNEELQEIVQFIQKLPLGMVVESNLSSQKRILFSHKTVEKLVMELVQEGKDISDCKSQAEIFTCRNYPGNNLYVSYNSAEDYVAELKTYNGQKGGSFSNFGYVAYEVLGTLYDPRQYVRTNLKESTINGSAGVDASMRAINYLLGYDLLKDRDGEEMRLFIDKVCARYITPVLFDLVMKDDPKILQDIREVFFGEKLEAQS